MTILSWPAELPQRPLDDPFTDTLPDLDIASQPDIGPAKVRRETTAAVYQIAPVYKVNDWQKERIKRFYREEAQGRTNTWWLPEPGLDGWPLADADGETILTDADGTPLLITSRLLVRFISPPTFPRRPRPSLGWNATLTLEVLP